MAGFSAKILSVQIKGPQAALYSLRESVQERGHDGDERGDGPEQ